MIFLSCRWKVMETLMLISLKNNTLKSDQIFVLQFHKRKAVPFLLRFLPKVLYGLEQCYQCYSMHLPITSVSE